MNIVFIVLWLTLAGWLWKHSEPPIPPIKKDYPIITEIKGYTIGHTEPKLIFKEVL